jgi:hypothetical protein
MRVQLNLEDDSEPEMVCFVFSILRQKKDCSSCELRSQYSKKLNKKQYAQL